MKRIAFVLMIILVLSIVGFCTWLEFSVKAIVFVNDKQVTSHRGNETVIYRLYNSGVNIDKFTSEAAERIQTLEFTPEEMEAAALKAGKPEFYPAFSLSVLSMVDYASETGSKQLIKGSVTQQVAKGQTSANFIMKNLRIEVQSVGIGIGEPYTVLSNELLNTSNVPIKDENNFSLEMTLDNTREFGFDVIPAFDNTTTGTLTFNFIYDIYTDSILTSSALTDCLLTVTVDITGNADGTVTVDFRPENYSVLSDLEG